jgi:DNA-binding response OmpR family regulator
MEQILVVDDDPDILDALHFVLEDAGYTVKTCKDGEHAEKLTNGFSSYPKLIILDVLLSGKDGRDICKKLKHNARTKHIPIVMVSAHPSVKESVIESGANKFIPKPFDISVLLTFVSSTLATA